MSGTTEIKISIAGKAATLLPQVAKESGNTYFVLDGKPANARFGCKVPALAAALPTSVEVHGVTVPLTAKVKDDGRKTAGNHSATITVDGQEKTAKVVLTDHGNGSWQVIAAVFGKGGKTGGGKVNESLFA